MPPRARCPQCDYALTRLYRQRTGTTTTGTRSSKHTPTQYLECDRCARVYADTIDNVAEITPQAHNPPPPAPAPAAPTAPRGQMGAVEDALAFLDLVADEIPPATAATLRKKMERAKE